jgi:hypothetical protein
MMVPVSCSFPFCELFVSLILPLWPPSCRMVARTVLYRWP